MFQFIFTAGIFVLLARDVCSTSTTDLLTSSGTMPQSSSVFTSATNTGGGGISQSTATSGTRSSTQASSSSRVSQSSITSSQTKASTVASSASAASAASASTATSAKTGSTAVSTASSTAASTTPAFRCYEGNCTGFNCHKNNSIYLTLNEITCSSNQCAIKVTKNATWSLSEFTCNSGQCICQKKVSDQVEMCCSKSKCNDKNLECSRSSRFVTSLVVVVIAFINLLLFN